MNDGTKRGTGIGRPVIFLADEKKEQFGRKNEN